MTKFIFFSFFIFLFSLFFFCSKTPTGEDTVTFSGMVTLEGETDHSGVTVSLYKPVELDTALVRINQEYPNIGVQISQETEFDHREHTPVYSTTTAADGSWKIEGVAPSEYNVVAEKDSFGWRYFFIKQIETKANINITLKKIILLKNIADDINLKDEFVEIENLIIPQGHSLTISGLSYIIMKENSTIKVQGNFNVLGKANEFIKIYNTYKQLWREITIEPGGKFKAEYVYFKNGSFGLNIKSENTQIENSIFSDFIQALNGFAVKGALKIRNNLFRYNETAIEKNIVENIEILNNIFYWNNISIEVKSGQQELDSVNVIIKGNIFEKDINSIFINHPFATVYVKTKGVINNNLFNKSQYAIKLGLNAFINGQQNNFKNINNNFIEKYRNPDKKDTLNYQNNYWMIFNEIEIKNKIRDAQDDNETGTFIDVRNFSFEEFKIES